MIFMLTNNYDQAKMKNYFTDMLSIRTYSTTHYDL